MMLNGVDIKAVNMERDVLMVFFGRAVFSPVCVLALSHIFSIPPLMRNVFIIQSALPVMVQVPVLAGFYKADARYATVITTFSTIVCLVALPFWMVLIATFL
jgi:predicted permease